MTLQEGATSLATGIDTLEQGAGTLESGASKLAAGATELSDGADKLVSGSTQINEGAGTLATKSSGITPMTLPWVAGVVLLGIIGLAVWIIHRVRHARALETASL